jgi:hypothetical protein
VPLPLYIRRGSWGFFARFAVCVFALCAYSLHAAGAAPVPSFRGRRAGCPSQASRQGEPVMPLAVEARPAVGGSGVELSFLSFRPRCFLSPS